ncbi:MAG: NADH-quinone oxidoreductase subunit M [Geobacteraceae bacterium]|nr:NADH-quinone oxidoreductase subunit M [Geobacteraceae bacterium]
MLDNYPILSILIFLPFIGGLALLAMREHAGICRFAALGVSLLELVLAGAVWIAAPGASAAGALPGFFLVEDLPWIERFGIRYFLAMDGISLLMVLLGAFLVTIAILFSWKNITHGVARYHSLLLLATAGMLGVFLSQDLFLFYMFWELMLIPLFCLIVYWGSGRPFRAAMRFFLFTMGGSALMLLAIIGLHLAHGSATGVYTFAMPELLRTPMTPQLSCWLFAAFMVAFAVKTPVFPFHGWLPDAYTSAPVAATVLLAGLMAKTGVYGMLRFAFPLFPQAAAFFAPALMVLAVAGILYSSWLACAQSDIKRLLAYSSFGHTGFMVLGVAAWTPVALAGSVMQMVNHGITASAMFLMAGILEERSGSRHMAGFGGLWGRMPVFGAFFLLFSLSSLGLPGLNNFVGEFLILAGTFRVSPVATVAALCGMVLVLIYSLKLVQQLLFGRGKNAGDCADLSLREKVMVTILAALVVLLGIYPAPVLDLAGLPVALLTGGRGVLP